MMVKALSEISTARGIVPAGQIIEIPGTALIKLKGKVEPLIDAYDLPHFCKQGDCHCSAKLPEADHPTECIRIGCEYHHDTKGETL